MGVTSVGVPVSIIFLIYSEVGTNRESGILLIASVVLLIILIPIGVLVVGKKKQTSISGVVGGLGKGEKGGDISDIDPNSVPVGSTLYQV